MDALNVSYVRLRFCLKDLFVIGLLPSTKGVEEVQSPGFIVQLIEVSPPVWLKVGIEERVGEFELLTGIQVKIPDLYVNPCAGVAQRLCQEEVLVDGTAEVREIQSPKDTVPVGVVTLGLVEFLLGIPPAPPFFQGGGGGETFLKGGTGGISATFWLTSSILAYI